MPTIPVLRKPKPDDYMFKTSLGYIVRFCFKTNMQNPKQQQQTERKPHSLTCKISSNSMELRIGKDLLGAWPSVANCAFMVFPGAALQFSSTGRHWAGFSGA